MQYDLIVRNGRIFDGTGAPSWIGDVGIKRVNITTLAQQIPEAAAEEVDATGQWVMPGFIDFHTP